MVTNESVQGLLGNHIQKQRISAFPLEIWPYIFGQLHARYLLPCCCLSSTLKPLAMSAFYQDAHVNPANYNAMLRNAKLVKSLHCLSHSKEKDQRFKFSFEGVVFMEDVMSADQLIKLIKKATNLTTIRLVSENSLEELGRLLKVLTCPTLRKLYLIYTMPRTSGQSAISISDDLFRHLLPNTKLSIRINQHPLMLGMDLALIPVGDNVRSLAVSYSEHDGKKRHTQQQVMEKLRKLLLHLPYLQELILDKFSCKLGDIFDVIRESSLSSHLKFLCLDECHIMSKRKGNTSGSSEKALFKLLPRLFKLKGLKLPVLANSFVPFLPKSIEKLWIHGYLRLSDLGRLAQQCPKLRDFSWSGCDNHVAHDFKEMLKACNFDFKSEEWTKYTLPNIANLTVTFYPMNDDDDIRDDSYDGDRGAYLEDVEMEEYAGFFFALFPGSRHVFIDFDRFQHFQVDSITKIAHLFPNLITLATTNVLGVIPITLDDLIGRLPHLQELELTVDAQSTATRLEEHVKNKYPELKCCFEVAENPFEYMDDD